MQRVDLAPVPRVVRAAAWLYVLRRAVIAAAVFGAVGLAGLIVLAALAESFGQ